MRVLVIGTGALGCLFAARLARHAEVWMLGTWAEGVSAVERDGIRIHGPEGTWQVRVPARGEPDAVPAADVALVLVKSYQTERAARWAARCLTPSGLAVSLQNGLDNLGKLEAEVGRERSTLGVTFEGATLLGPGQVRHAGRGRTDIGQSPETAGAVGRLVPLLRQAGFAAETTDEIEGLAWGKALVNAAINPLTALWRVPNGQLLADANRRATLGMLASEAAAVAAARGVRLPYADPLARVKEVCRATASNHSSMLQDVERGRPTEIDAINGVIVSEGRRLGVAAPANEMVWRLVRGMGPGQDNSASWILPEAIRERR
jgi:2-dehydropantoate 2-reductase